MHLDVVLQVALAPVIVPHHSQQHVGQHFVQPAGAVQQLMRHGEQNAVGNATADGNTCAKQPIPRQKVSFYLSDQ